MEQDDRSPDLERGLRVFQAVWGGRIRLMSESFDEKLRSVLLIAEALREEFGISVDAHPGGDGIEAGSVNRAFRAAARVIVGEVTREEDDPAIIRTHLLREVALRWLAELGVGPEHAEVLVCSEPNLGDSWLAYLALAPISVIDDLTN
jgi:hypothetical protein